MSAKRIDQAEEARRLLALLPASMHEDEVIGKAQVHATLALAEQQRIANRIALAQVAAQATYASGYHGSSYGLVGQVGIFDHPATEHGTSPLHADIAEGLGLS